MCALLDDDRDPDDLIAEVRREFCEGLPDRLATIRAALQYVDAQRLYPCTNCGMAPIPYDTALGKLNSLAAGAALVRNSL